MNPMSFLTLKLEIAKLMSELLDSKVRLQLFLSLGSINTTAQLSNFIDNIVYTSSGTATHLALELLPTAFSTAQYTDQGIPCVAIVFIYNVYFYV